MARPYIIRIFSGLVFILAGLLAFYKISFGAPFALVFVFGGILILVAVLLGSRVHYGDVALFVVSLLLLGAVTSGINPQSTGAIVKDYTISSTDLSNVNGIQVYSNTQTGSISVQYSNNTSLGYEVKFTSGLFFSFNPFANLYSYSLTNSTKNGILVLNASTNYLDIQITLGQHYFTNIAASTGTGSVQLNSPPNVAIGNLSLEAGAGSINVNIQSKNVSQIYLNAGTGSINFEANYLQPLEQKVPLRLSTGTGSLNFRANIPSATAVSLNASTGFGSLSDTLPGFTVNHTSENRLSATNGNVNSASKSFLISLSTGTGSLNVEIRPSAS